MKQWFLVLIILAIGLSTATAHTVNYALEGQPATQVVWYYLVLGFEHIIPSGLDHILFIIGLYLLSPQIKHIVWQATAFTVAHTLTLILTMNNTISAPSELIEPIIALSIAFVALENIVLKTWKPWRMALVFAFGLVHGMGFASALNESGLPRDAFYTTLLTFNVGVEIGQLVVIALCHALFGYWCSQKIWYRSRLVYPLSILIAAVACFWTFERIFA